MICYKNQIKMDLRSKHQVNATFSLSGMTDVVFLLLIFFMLTSTVVTPTGVPVNLPSSKTSNIVLQKVSVTITPDLRYFVNSQEVSEGSLEGVLRNALSEGDGVVVLHIDKTVPTEYLVKVAGIAAALEAKVSIAANPQSK